MPPFPLSTSPAGPRPREQGSVYNAANEEAAAAFLSGRIHFPEIVDVVGTILDSASEFAGVVSSLDEILAVEGEARRRANALIDSLAD